MVVKQPPPVTIFPIFRCLPLFVKGTPVFLAILDLAAEIPESLFIENPPLFICIFSFKTPATDLLSLSHSVCILSQQFEFLPHTLDIFSF